MSRMGKVPIVPPDKVQVTVGKSNLKVKGPKGELSFDFKPFVTIRQEDKNFWVDRVSDSKTAKSHQGLVHRMFGNLLIGVTEGFSKTLEMVGVGYKAEAAGSKLTMSIGFSHPVVYEVPKGIEVTVDKTVIRVSGIDKQRVGQVAAEIRAIRKPDNYKGKGIRYQGEHVRIKPGKAAVGTGF